MVSPYQFTLPGIAPAAVVSKGSYVGMTLHTNTYLPASASACTICSYQLYILMGKCSCYPPVIGHKRIFHLSHWQIIRAIHPTFCKLHMQLKKMSKNNDNE